MEQLASTLNPLNNHATDEGSQQGKQQGEVAGSTHPMSKSSSDAG